MTALTVTVNDTDLASQIESWQDGTEYNLRVRQDAPGQFTAVSAEEAGEGEPEEEAAATEESETPGGMMGGGKMPAVAIVVGRGARGK
mgnify:CR=1 FL=1